MTTIQRDNVGGSGVNRRPVNRWTVNRSSNEEVADAVRDAWCRRDCVVCGRMFVDAKNLGTWACRRHPGVLAATMGDAETDVGAFTCCNRPAGSPGCVRTDHTDDGADDALWPLSIDMVDLSLLVSGSTTSNDRAVDALLAAAGRERIIYDTDNHCVTFIRIDPHLPDRLPLRHPPPSSSSSSWIPPSYHS
jgi:hypothetical protein